MTEEETEAFFSHNYALSPEKTNLLTQTARVQQDLYRPQKGKAALYVHIPLCPSKCAYCSFPSKVTDMGSADCQRYLDALLRELSAMRGFSREMGWKIDCVYVGGGTPSILSAPQLARLLGEIRDFAPDAGEFTFEGGRADTLSKEKLRLLKEGGVNRLSINPQTMKDETLVRIGRPAGRESFLRAMEEAARLGFESVNCDLILGLEGEREDDCRDSLKEVLALSPVNLTLHTLCSKKSADIRAEEIAQIQMDAPALQDEARALLAQAGYCPYYLYKQKYAIGGGENVGYAKAGRECLYNIRMMAETQPILSAGASAATKLPGVRSGSCHSVYTVKEFRLYTEDISRIVDKKLAELRKFVLS